MCIRDRGLGEVMGTLLTNFVANPVSAIMSGNYIGILFWACMFGVAMKKIANRGAMGMLGVDVEGKTVETGDGPVSYTHLDVYKRQLSTKESIYQNLGDYASHLAMTLLLDILYSCRLYTSRCG